MVSGTRAIGVTHTLGVPRKAHRLLINFGRWKLRNVATFNLHANIAAFDGFASNFAVLDFSKQRLIKVGALSCTCGSSGRSTTASTTSTTATTSIGRKLLQDTLNTSERGCSSEATDHRRVITGIRGSRPSQTAELVEFNQLLERIGDNRDPKTSTSNVFEHLQWIGERYR